jgi:hypothetical protein
MWLGSRIVPAIRPKLLALIGVQATNRLVHRVQDGGPVLGEQVTIDVLGVRSSRAGLTGMIRSSRAQANSRRSTEATVLLVLPEAGVPSCRVSCRIVALSSGRSKSPIKAARVGLTPQITADQPGSPHNTALVPRAVLLACVQLASRGVNGGPVRLTVIGYADPAPARTDLAALWM